MTTPRIDILLPNEDEIKRMTSKATLEDALDALTGVVPLIVVKCGRRGAIVHVTRSSSIWIQESYNKVVTIPWYTTSSIGYTYSW
jgi:sugar/nucleoside kinase (ribokinase family)